MPDLIYSWIGWLHILTIDQRNDVGFRLEACFVLLAKHQFLQIDNVDVFCFWIWKCQHVETGVGAKTFCLLLKREAKKTTVNMTYPPRNPTNVGFEAPIRLAVDDSFVTIPEDASKERSWRFSSACAAVIIVNNIANILFLLSTTWQCFFI